MKFSDELETRSNNHPRMSAQGPSGVVSESKSEPNDLERALDGASAANLSSEPEPTGGVLDVLLQFVQDVTGSAGSLIEVYADRARLSVRRKIVQAVIVFGIVVCAAVWLGAAALATLRGVCGGLTELWGGRAWLGDLSGGVLALSFAAGAFALYVRVSSRREHRKLKAKYERIRTEREKRHEKPAAPGNSGTTPGPGGSAGDPGHHRVGAAHG